MKKIFLLIVYTVFLSNIYGETPDDLIGLTPADLIDKVGAPQKTLVERGGKKIEDDVVFFYPNRTYFYLNRSRVWQVRYDKKYSDEILGFSLGDDKSRVIEILGDPLRSDTYSIVYKRPDKGYPVFLRIFFENNKVDDVYLYRGDY